MYILEKEFWDYPALILAFAVTVFAVVMLRYLLLAFGYLQLILRTKPLRHKVSLAERLKFKNKEIAQSAVSYFIFTVLSVFMYWTYHQGWTKVYTSVNAYSWWYFFASVVMVLWMYETYYYWLHRWMHIPSVFRVVHKTHHENKNPSVFTSFAFHPLEAILQFLPLPIIVYLIPIHYMALFIVLMLMTVSALINHAGVEIFPSRFQTHPIAQYLIGSTHHDLHHREFNTNYGLYFTFWDRWMKTESPRYKQEFEKNTAGQKLH